MSFEEVVKLAGAELNTNKDWKELSKSEKITIWSKKLFKEADIDCFKFESTFNCKPEELAFLLWETEYRVKWNSDQFKEVKILKQM
jgi:hypothetical protein